MIHDQSRITRIAQIWIIAAAAFYCYDILRDTGQTLAARGRPIGDDFVNFWSGAWLAWHDRAADVYGPAYHAFQQGVVGPDIGFYNYSYSPVLLLLSAPLAVLPYVPGLVAWLAMSWFAFFRALRLTMPGRNALLVAAATPAVFISALGGQNGCWTAALLGGGLSVLQRRPAVAGVLFGLLIYKPHLGLLIPVALLAGRQWRALVAASATVAVLIASSLALVGPSVWNDYLHHADELRRVAIENGAGVWHRTISLFVLARHLGASVPEAYAMQIAAALAAAAVVALAWSRNAATPIRYALLVLGSFLATPYLQDYDLVVGAFVVVWLVTSCEVVRDLRQPARIASALILIAPLAASVLVNTTGIALGALLLIPGFAVAARFAFGRTTAMSVAVQARA